MDLKQNNLHNETVARISKLHDKARFFRIISLISLLVIATLINVGHYVKAEAKSVVNKTKNFKIDEKYLRVLPKEVIKKSFKKYNNKNNKVKYRFTDEEKMLIYQTVQAEAGGESLMGRKAVAQVIINRYNMSKKKDIKKILINRKQFSCVSRGGRIIGDRPTKETIKAVNAILQGEKVIPKDATYYYAPRYLPNGCWASRNQKYLCTIGGHKFYSCKKR